MTMNWSELPYDILGLIISFRPIADAHRFSAVCRDWNYAFRGRGHYPQAPQLPWLVLADHEITKKRVFYNISEERYYHFDIPELRGARCCGSSFGWLIAVGPKLETHLLNPFSGAKYSLPRLPCYGDKLEYTDDCLVLHVDDSEPSNLSYEKMQQFVILKAILSADPKECSDFMLMIMINEDPKLAIWRAGDKDWMILKERNYIKEIVCFKGQFFALLAHHVLATVEVNPEPKLVVHKTCLRDCANSIKQYFINVNDTCLLLVLRNNVPDKSDDEHFLTSEFRVFELDLDEEYEAYEIEDIDGNSLFLGKNSGIIVPSSKFKGCRENSIYFSSDTGFAAPKEKYGYDDTGIWSIVDETIEPIFQSDVYIPPTSCPIWLVPNP